MIEPKLIKKKGYASRNLLLGEITIQNEFAVSSALNRWKCTNKKTQQ